VPAASRLLVPVLVALAIVARAMVSWAAIEVTGGPACCCPDPARCDCFDSERDHDAAPTVERCSRDPVQAVMPIEAPAVMPPAPTLPMAPRAIASPRPRVPALAERAADRPDKPPS